MQLSMSLASRPVAVRPARVQQVGIGGTHMLGCAVGRAGREASVARSRIIGRLRAARRAVARHRALPGALPICDQSASDGGEALLAGPARLTAGSERSALRG